MKVSFSRKIRVLEPGGTIETTEVEVEVEARVVLGPGGPDPTEVDLLSVLYEGQDITSKLPDHVLDRLGDEAADVAYDKLAGEEPDYDP